MRKTEGSLFFVMLDSGNRTPVPLVDDDENVALFDTESEAESAGRRNPLGNAFGYDVYEWSVA